MKKPHFELTRVPDGSDPQPQLVPVTEMPWQTSMDRRGFLGAGAAAAAVLFAVREGDAAQPPTPVVAHDAEIAGVHIDRASKRVISAGKDGLIKVWSLPDAKLVRRIDSTRGIDAIAATPDGTRVLALHEHSIRAWSASSGEVIRTVARNKEEDPWFEGLVLSHDARSVAYAAAGIEIRPVGAGRGATLGDRKPDVLAFSADDELLVSASRNGPITVWSVRGREIVTKIDDGAEHLVIDSANRLIATSDRQVTVYSLPEGKELTSGSVPDDSGSIILSAALLPDEELLACGISSKVYLWSVRERCVDAVLIGHPWPVYQLAVSADGKYLVSGGNDGTMILWDLPRRRLITYFYDRVANEREDRARRFDIYDKITGRTITYTLPCGTPIPAGAKCICNCVAGTRPGPPEDSGSSSTFCTCNKVCTCVPVYY
jgi:WD40 repeat protein